jgi:hypothetical protein
MFMPKNTRKSCIKQRRSLEDADEAGGDQPRPFRIRDAQQRDQQPADTPTREGDRRQRDRPLRGKHDDPELVDAERSDQWHGQAPIGSMDI